jgi:hypothetical protein
MVQPGLSVPPEQHHQSQKIRKMLILLPHSGASAVQAAASVINETMPSENKKEEKKDTDTEANEDGENKKSKDSKALKLFRIALDDSLYLFIEYLFED